MSYYADLTKYAHHLSFLRPKTLNVGWLDGSHQFETARPARWIVDKLWAYCEYSLAEARGFHECNLTDCPGPARKFRHSSCGGKAAALREAEQHHAFLRRAIQAGPPGRQPTAHRARFLEMLDEDLRIARRGYSK